MATDNPTPRNARPASYWPPPSTGSPDGQFLARFRLRFVAVVAALVVQATIAFLGVLPDLPGFRDPAGSAASYAYASLPVSFWMQFAVVESIAALVVSFAFGPIVRLRDVPVFGRLVLGFSFVVVPAVAIVLGALDAAQDASSYGPAAVASSWLTTVLFGTLFFGLPLLALGDPASPAPTSQRPT